MTVLGISTNTRLFGVAIIQDGSLLDYRISPHKQAWSPAKVTRILSFLEPCVRRYSPKRVVLSIPHLHHQTPEWKELTASLENHIANKGLTLQKKNIEDIYSLCPHGERKTKKALMLSLTSVYPELSYCYYKEARNKNKYYIKLFEAVAAAMLCDSE